MYGLQIGAGTFFAMFIPQVPADGIHRPDPQIGQSSGWLISRNSTTPFRASSHLVACDILYHHAIHDRGAAACHQFWHRAGIGPAEPAATPPGGYGILPPLPSSLL